MLQTLCHWSRIALAIFLIAIPQAAMSAADEPAATENPEMVRSDPATQPSVGRKLQRGLASLLLGVLEIPATVANESREHGNAVGVVLGLTEGVGRFAARELFGVYQLVTAPFVVPDPYPGVFSDEFPWSSFARGVGGLSATEVAQLTRELGWIRGAEIERGSDAVILRFPGKLLFPVGSDQLSDAAQPRLIGLAETLKRHLNLQIEVQGHADSMGSATLNQSLSERRAKSVQASLITLGVERERVKASGFGTSRPIAGNDTAEGRSSNRRVEVALRALPPMVGARE
jgi:putative exosortase-associated protein (TIGR04073 family)